MLGASDPKPTRWTRYDRHFDVDVAGWSVGFLLAESLDERTKV
jgi:hypothetical protein